MASSPAQSLRRRSSQNIVAKGDRQIGVLDVESQELQVVATSPPKDGAQPETIIHCEGDPAVGHDSILHGFRLYAVTIGLCFGALMMSLDISIIGTVGT